MVILYTAFKVEASRRKMAVELPQWLQDMRRAEVVGRVRDDPRSRQDTFFGLTKDEAMNCVGGGQAQFDEPWGEMSPADRALLYAYFNQKGHLEELTEAFRLVFANQMPNNPIVIDLGCGPATGGLALAGVLDPPNFDYIGVDQSVAMRGLGEQLAASAPRLKAMRRCWASDLESVGWNRAPGWRPVLVIVSYLLASRTLKPATLVDQLDALLARLGNGRATMLYTNSPRPRANRNFPAFKEAMRRAGFNMPADGTGEITIDRWTGEQRRQLRYAVFHRPAAERTLRLGDC